MMATVRTGRKIVSVWPASVRAGVASEGCRGDRRGREDYIQTVNTTGRESRHLRVALSRKARSHHDTGQKKRAAQGACSTKPLP